MGSIISPPKAPKIVPVAMPKPAETDTAASEEEKKKLEEMLDRRRSNAASTIMTSYRGLLQESPTTPQRKTLLGE